MVDRLYWGELGGLEGEEVLVGGRAAGGGDADRVLLRTGDAE
jgi:hypothetical protein